MRSTSGGSRVAASTRTLRSVIQCDGVVWCGVVWCGVVWCGVVWCGVVWCGVVWCGVVWCGVVWCGVVWSGVVWCGVVWCGLVWCGVVWCGVVWCGMVWCAEGAIARRQWPACLPTGTSPQEGCVSSTSGVCKCLVIGGKRGGRGNLDVTDRAKVVSGEVPVVLRLCAHAGARVGPTTTTPSCRSGPGGLSATWLAPCCGRTKISWTPRWRFVRTGSLAWRGYARPPPSFAVQVAPTADGTPIQPVSPPCGRATPRAAGEPSPTHGNGPSRPKRGGPFWAELHRGGTWCAAPCFGGKTGAPRHSWWGRCPCGALYCGDASHYRTSRG